MRAFWLPVAGALAVVIVVWLAALFPLPHDIFVAALTALTTLTASAAGHAAGHAASSRRAAGDDTSESGKDPQP
jgi:hypothetical protein